MNIYTVSLLILLFTHLIYGQGETSYETSIDDTNITTSSVDPEPKYDETVISFTFFIVVVLTLVSLLLGYVLERCNCAVCALLCYIYI